MASEKEKVNLQAENTALGEALSSEQQRRHDIEVELKSISQVINLDLTSPSKSDVSSLIRNPLKVCSILFYKLALDIKCPELPAANHETYFTGPHNSTMRIFRRSAEFCRFAESCKSDGQR